MFDYLKKELPSFIFSLGKKATTNQKELFNLAEIFTPFIFNLVLYSFAYIYSAYSESLNPLNISWQLSLVSQVLFFFVSGMRQSTFYLENLTFTILVSVHFLRLAVHLYTKCKNKAQEEVQQMFKWHDAFTRFIPELLTVTLLGRIFSAFLHSKTEVSQPLYWNGVLLMISATVFESIADVQLYSFKQNKLKKELILDRGFWAISRHPNYFGEALFWLGLYSCSVSRGVYWTIFAPLIRTALLLFVSLPKVEAHLVNDHGLPFKSYQKRVSAFVPWIPKKTDVLHKFHFTEPIGNYNMDKNPDFSEWKKDQKNIKLYENEKKFNKIRKSTNGSNTPQFYRTLQ